MVNTNTPLEQELWNKWIRNRSSEAANELVNHYIYLVLFHVERICSHLPKTVSKDDIKSLGLIGLYDALKKFEPNRDLKFDTYASIRIRGAIIDGLRKEDWLPRSLRDKVKKVEQAQQQLEQKHHRAPTSSEIADEIGISVQEVETVVKDSLFANVLSIEEKPKSNHSGNLKEGIGYSIPEDLSMIPENQIIQEEVKNELIEAIKNLNEREQLVISLFYFDELTLTEIGQVLDLTTSRISQIHKKAVFKLKNVLSKLQYLS
ncbi:FliA/WhiG family RNA polymerase sigma factor [Oceanobacillus piezotolerans]|uniref:FliA/WhiG family RNA polymerase sigma factor n=1 Tax=Oceanobacillus piezotolerans TaxID=2448030 RepID=A0A498D6Q6_9BACI|nr:FliA/WhiG family RNA polymerase sigma factor [Oceanobacillus piezotolerans]RLL45339.1 FliA/WhiG family RNA polymerase sigma factor [Oceanobacillus piezotolerans]